MTASAELPKPEDWAPDGGWPDDLPTTTQPAGWLTESDLAVVRALLPIVYVDAIPVRVDETGDVTSIGLLLRIGAGKLNRAVVSGRVLYHERVRDALLRHLEKDLGPMALPKIPPSPQPFTVAEYLPTPGITPFNDPRQHAISLAYVVPVTGDCHPRQDAIVLEWVTPEEACSDEIQDSFIHGQGALVRQAVAWLGRLA